MGSWAELRECWHTAEMGGPRRRNDARRDKPHVKPHGKIEPLGCLALRNQRTSWASVAAPCLEVVPKPPLRVLAPLGEGLPPRLHRHVLLQAANKQLRVPGVVPSSSTTSKFSGPIRRCVSVVLLIPPRLCALPRALDLCRRADASSRPSRHVHGHEPPTLPLAPEWPILWASSAGAREPIHGLRPLLDDGPQPLGGLAEAGQQCLVSHGIRAQSILLQHLHQPEQGLPLPGRAQHAHGGVVEMGVRAEAALLPRGTEEIKGQPPLPVRIARRHSEGVCGVIRGHCGIPQSLQQACGCDPLPLLLPLPEQSAEALARELVASLPHPVEQRECDLPTFGSRASIYCGIGSVSSSVGISGS
mmetsp:Transcript_132906/g.425382  ORF Transcript_132906/g.425382 Transcript_132906/m.425382 type:complete len:359 (+) Transcript_132906:201-1277(+)